MQGLEAAVVLEDAVEYDEQNGDEGYALLCRHIDYNGGTTGFVSTKIKIPEFKGSKPLSSLPAVPLRTREDQQEVTEKLVRQGKRFAELRNASFLEYSGVAFLTNNRDRDIDDEEQRVQTQVCPKLYFY
jgi:hypothetical protein